MVSFKKYCPNTLIIIIYFLKLQIGVNIDRKKVDIFHLK
jgi:hypothetical protein